MTRPGGTSVSNAVAANIRLLRKARGWTQEELAKRSGISVDVLNHMETGRRGGGERTRRIAVDELIALADSLGVAASDLLPALGAPTGDVARVNAERLAEDARALHLRARQLQADASHVASLAELASAIAGTLRDSLSAGAS